MLSGIKPSGCAVTLAGMAMAPVVSALIKWQEVGGFQSGQVPLNAKILQR